ncbi:MAG: UDP-3-O-(3-hydroxymyristoyl)glucosamine N-acyltransferase [Crocinitomicaceae bacterium]
MEFSAQQIAGMLQGEVIGNPEQTVNDLSKIEEGKAGTLSFLANPKYEEYIYTTGASIVIVGKDFQAKDQLPETLTLVKVEDAYSCFAKLLDAYNQMREKQPQIEEPVKIADTAEIGQDVYIGSFSYIGEGTKIGKNVKIYPGCYLGDNCIVGDDTVIFAGVKIYQDTQIGKDCRIHSGCVIGADGFGFSPNAENNYQRVPQIGKVVIEDHVDLGANVTIDRATLGNTYIRKGVKLDNMVHIAHNCDIGENTVMAAQCGIAGSTKVGKNVMFGGQVGVNGHIEIADKTLVAAKAAIANSVKERAMLIGQPAIPAGEFKKAIALFRKLPELAKRLGEVEKKLEQ